MGKEIFSARESLAKRARKWYNQSMKKNNVYEDKEAKRRADIERHTLPCPHCGTPVLDHLTKCPHCGGTLEPKGYRPLSDEKIKKIRWITYSIGAVLTVVIVVLIILYK